MLSTKVQTGCLERSLRMRRIAVYIVQVLFATIRFETSSKAKKKVMIGIVLVFSCSFFIDATSSVRGCKR